jgi:cytochrome oxidase Cu insertion factor (SCO1/SenC/PrrC family)
MSNAKAAIGFLLAFMISTAQAMPLRLQSVRTTSLGVGEIAPDFALEDQLGSKHTLSEARGKSPVVLVFYRGYW